MKSKAPTRKRPRSVIVHLSEEEYLATIRAADRRGLQTGPWVRMNLLDILQAEQAKQDKENGDASNA